MSKSDGFVYWIKTKVRALFPEDWMSSAGKDFKNGLETAQKFTDKYVMPEAVSLVEDAASLGSIAVRGAATAKAADATDKFAHAEGQKIQNAIALRTMEADIRIKEAAATKAEADAEAAQLGVEVTKISIAKARMELLRQYQEIGVVGNWQNGKYWFTSAPEEFKRTDLDGNLLEDSKKRPHAENSLNDAQIHPLSLLSASDLVKAMEAAFDASAASAKVIKVDVDDPTQSTDKDKTS